MVQTLEQTAKKLGYRIAIPQATTLCQGMSDLYCWRGERRETVEKTWAQVTAAAATCFPGGAKSDDFGVIGFSNGGYHLGRVVMRGLEPLPKWGLAIGSAGNLAHAEGASAAAKSIPLTFLAGKSDGVRAEARNLSAALAERGFATEFREVEGGHAIPITELEAILMRWGRVASR